MTELRTSPPDPAGDEDLLFLDGVRLGYGRRVVLDHVTLRLGRGDYLGIVGPNGAGKTTLILGLLDLLPPLAGRFLRSPGVRYGYVPQRQNLDDIFPLTVRDIVMMGVELAHGPAAPGEDVDALLARVDLAGRAGARFRELSGGQRQRVLLARALAVDPDVLVLDEPTNGLDLPSEAAFMALVARFNAAGRTVIMVTHLLNLVANHARSLALVGSGGVHAGPAGVLLTEEALGRIYHTGVRVVSVDGRRVVLPAVNGGRDETGGGGRPDARLDAGGPAAGGTVA